MCATRERVRQGRASVCRVAERVERIMLTHDSAKVQELEIQIQAPGHMREAAWAEFYATPSQDLLHPSACLKKSADWTGTTASIRNHRSVIIQSRVSSGEARVCLRFRHASGFR